MATIRIDDISPNTNFLDLKEQIHALTMALGDPEFICGLTVFSKETDEGSVYPGAPFRKNQLPFFYDINRALSLARIRSLYMPEDSFASHGLIHVDHKLLSYDAQEMSIVSSCKYLKAKRFIPPFNSYNHNTLSICKKNAIEPVINTETVKWKSLEFHDYDASHEYWYYHPWRFALDELEAKLNVKSAVPASALREV